MKLTLLASDLSHNALSRVYLLGEILRRDHDVEIVGTTFGRGIWEPAATGVFDYGVVPGRRWPLYFNSIRHLLSQIRGDVVYAIKPLPSSFGVALLDRARTGRPLILDIDDDELAFRPPVSVRHPLRLAASLAHPNGRLWTRGVLRKVACADAITVASRGLQTEFGGTILPHARDTDRVYPRPELTEAAKVRFGLAGRRVAMFIGTPRPHKGIEDVAAAIRAMRNDVAFVVAGADAADEYVRSLRRSFGDITFLPPYRYDELPFILQAADAVVVPQRRRPETERQQPAKLLDAMAVAKPIIATAVADIPEILAEGRGFVVPPGDVPAMAAALDSVFDSPDGAVHMGALAREWCERHGSYHAARKTLSSVFAAVLERAALRRMEQPGALHGRDLPT